ncbi:MAG TPA: 50S ribosomal protein L25/general stress protein Ctc [Aeromonadales bacterium]|nr:50S ribosomal protein L25/general stress protein Ctc [Aeromonadales bacterium]
MSEANTLNAEVRKDMGKGASRRLRHSGLIPAVIYGGGKDSVALTLNHDEFFHALENESFYSSIITLKVGKKKEKAILKDLQRHPWKNLLSHADFLRVKMDEEITTNVPLHFINEDNCHGVKMEGGQLTHLFNDVEITCLPNDLPEYIDVDVAALELGSTIHLTELVLPEGVEITALTGPDAEEHDQGVVSVIKKKAETEEVAEAGEAAEGEEASDSSEEEKSED